MIQPIIAAQVSSPVASIQQNTDSQGVIQSQQAHVEVQKEEQQIRETVVQKDEAVFYQQNHDAKEEGRNKYVNLYSGKKKKNPDKDGEKKEKNLNRINIEI